MRVIDWFEKFYEDHRKRHPRHDWPKYDVSDAFIEAWIAQFTMLGVTQEDADLVSVQSTAEDISFLNEHLPTFINLVKGLHSSRREEHVQDQARTREEAVVISSDCPECEGIGRAIRKYTIPDRYNTEFDGSLFCRCSLGRFDENQYREEWPDERARRDDLQAHPELWDTSMSHRTWSTIPSRNPQGSFSPFRSYWIPRSEDDR